MAAPGSFSFETLLSERSKRRQPSMIRALTPLALQEGMISFAGGMPNPSQFPLDGIEVRLKDGTKLQVEDVAKCQQYSASGGMPRLLELWKQVIAVDHGAGVVDRWPGVKPAGLGGGSGAGAAPNKVETLPNDVAVMHGIGSQDLLSRYANALIDENNQILIEAPAYTGVLSIFQPLGAELVEVDTDEDGIIIENLQAILESSASEKQLHKIKFLYICPNGGNPSGRHLTVARRWVWIGLDGEAVGGSGCGGVVAGVWLRGLRRRSFSCAPMCVVLGGMSSHECAENPCTSQVCPRATGSAVWTSRCRRRRLLRVRFQQCE